jgi:hypothetical protein
LVNTQTPIRVKFFSKGHRGLDNDVFLRQMPGRQPRWGRCEFIFDIDERQYDWLVCYDDLAPLGEERFSERAESLACARDHTLFITMEPSTIKVYGYDFLEQFGGVLTSQEPWAIRNSRAIYSQPALRWYYGVGAQSMIDWDNMTHHPPLEKAGVFSTVCSNKQHGSITLHSRRVAFTEAVAERIGELVSFGRGKRPIDDKADAVAPYKYHLAIENHIAPHHWTEKLADAFLGASLPFYVGCPNATDYFSEDSFIPLNLHDIEGSLNTIRRAIDSGEYEKRLPAIMESRRRVLNEYNLFAVIAKHIESRHDERKSAEPGSQLFSRHAFRRRNVSVAVRFLWERFRVSRRARSGVRKLERMAA